MCFKSKETIIGAPLLWVWVLWVCRGATISEQYLTIKISVITDLFFNYHWAKSTNMNMLCFKFYRNRTINEEFDVFERGWERPPRSVGVPIHKFLSQLLWYKNHSINEEFDKVIRKLSKLEGTKVGRRKKKKQGICSPFWLKFEGP